MLRELTPPPRPYTASFAFFEALWEVSSDATMRCGCHGSDKLDRLEWSTAS